MDLTKHFKKLVLSLVFTGFSLAHAGSYDDFWTAIRRDNAWGISQLINSGFDPNTVDAKGQHGLTRAIFEESYKAAAVLAGTPRVNLNYLNPAGESALMMAALKGQTKLMSDLIAKGADVNKPGWTALHYAATKGDVATIRLLLDEHAYVDAESPNGSTPLMMAAQYGSPEAVRLLLAEGAQHQQKNQLGLTALDFAQRASRPDAIAILSALARQDRLKADGPDSASSALPRASPRALPPALSPASPPAASVSNVPMVKPVPQSQVPVTPEAPKAPATRPSW